MLKNETKKGQSWRNRQFCLDCNTILTPIKSFCQDFFKFSFYAIIEETFQGYKMIRYQILIEKVRYFTDIDNYQHCDTECYFQLYADTLEQLYKKLANLQREESDSRKDDEDNCVSYNYGKIQKVDFIEEKEIEYKKLKLF